MKKTFIFINLYFILFLNFSSFAKTFYIGDEVNNVFNFNRYIKIKLESDNWEVVRANTMNAGVLQRIVGIARVENNEIIKIQEKPDFNFYVNAGIYVFDKNVFNFLDENKFCDMPEFLTKLKIIGKTLNGFPIHEYWLDIGKPDSFNQARIDW